MNESANRIRNILRGTRIKDVEPYLPARVIFELGNYNKELPNATSATKKTFLNIENSALSREEVELLKNAYNLEDLNLLQQQLVEITQAVNEMRGFCKLDEPALAASCQKLQTIELTIEKNADLLVYYYLQVLDKI